jgi:hypothetical protein
VRVFYLFTPNFMYKKVYTWRLLTKYLQKSTYSAAKIEAKYILVP